ncbi:Coiled-coil and C2 domain-containing protein 2A, partial [Fasciola gigantica]
NANHENPAAIELDQNIEQYEQEISLIRRSRNHAEAVQRGLLASALRAWKRVKQARQLTGYTNTTVRLKITQELVDKNQEQNEWDKELDDIVEESRVLHEQKSKPLQQAYSEELAKYRAAKKRQATAMKRQRARESGKELDTEMNGATLADTEKEDARTLAEVNLYKPPLPPAKFNAQVVRVQAEAQMVKSRRLPGEPKIAVSLSETTPVTLDSACPEPELLRRRDMSKYQYFVKLYFNHKYVEKTNLVSLSQDFTVNFAWTYPLHICHYPESILVKFFEKHGYRTREIAEFSLSPPELVPTDEHHPTEEQEQPAVLQRLGFTVTTSKQPTSYVTGPEAQSKCAVGSPALALIESLDGCGEYQTLLTENGQLIASTTWGPFSGEVQPIGRPDRVNFSNVSSYGCAGSVKPYNRFEELGQSDRPVSLQSLFTSRLGEFISESDKNALSEIPLSKLDPNDPADARLLSLVQALSGSQLSLGDAVKSTGTDVTRPHLSLTTRAAGVNYFRLDPLIKEFEFCDEKTLDQSRRFRLLQLRQAGVSQFRSIAVPIASKYIPSDVFIDYEERRRKRVTKDVTGMKAYRLRHQVYVEKIKSQVSQRFQEALRQKSYREVVIEEKIPNFFFILPLLRRLTEARRPLKVKRVERRPVAAQNVQNTGLQLLLTVHAAYNLPTRKMTAGTEQLGTSRRGEPIRPLVEVSFQNHLCTTSTSEGNNPSWNAELQLPFNFKGKSTPLEAVNDSISINVYDEVVIETDEGRLTVEPNSTVQRIERRLLGGFEVPFSTVYLNGKIDGKVPLTVPLVLQGYDLYSDGHASAKPMLHVFMALEPSVHPPEPLETSFTCTEPPEVLSLVEEWRQKLIKSKTLDPNQFNPLVMNTDCKQVVMTRYLCALNPPSELLPGTDTGLSWNESVLRLARYVSLIPYESDVAYFRGLPDLWCTSDQFLGMVCGDEEEHAVLLACYLLHLDQLRQTSETDEQNAVSLRVYLCIGEAVPEGQTVYVLTSEERGDFLGSGRKWKLWNPLRGQSFSVNNANGPMRSIYGIASAQNVWANIQPKKQPWELDWDLTSKKSWLPLFPVRSAKRKRRREVASDERPPLATVQPTLLMYDQLDPREVENIKFELEASLRDALMVWRRNKITRINYEYISDLTKVLENLEKHNGCPYDGLNKVLDRISSKYEVYGFPMNFPYAEIPVILERVKAKGIHNLLGLDSELDFGDSVNLFRTPRSMGDSRSSNQDSLPRQSVQSSLNNLQFALAVYVKAYPGPVLSIWVYLAALWRRIHTL